MRKSVAKAATPFSTGACTNTGEAFALIIDRLSPLACMDLSPHACPQRSSRIKYLLHWLGIPRVLVVSSYDAVKDCLNINDKVFAARPGILVGEYIGYNNAMLFLASYDDYWRKIRKIVINEVLSSSKLEKLRDVRVSEVKTSIKDLYSLFPITGDQNLDFPVTGDHFPVTRDNFPVGGDDISFIVDGENVITSNKQPLTEIQGKDSYNKVFLSNPSLDPMHGVSFSAKGDKVIKSWKQPGVEMQGKALYNSAHSECFNSRAVSGANLDFLVTGGDFRVKVNITNWIEKLTLSLIVKMIAGKSYGRVEKGHIKFMKRTFKDIDCVLQSWLDEHVKKRESVDFVEGNEEDFIDVMLSMMSNEDFVDGYSRETTIKATALSMVLVASDTTAIHLNWVMATLLNHKDAMKKVQDELDTNVGRNRWVEESDIKDLVYFQAVVKETLQLYPPAPLLAPHESVEDCIVQGYHIPKGTRLWVNTMKLHRDPMIWSNPDTFDPERFLTSQAGVDVRGHHYEFIPFGSGRRSCPGITYATQVTHLAIAHLLQGFDFSTPSDEPLDMKEGLGVTMRKADPIELTGNCTSSTHLKQSRSITGALALSFQFLSWTKLALGHGLRTSASFPDPNIANNATNDSSQGIKNCSTSLQDELYLVGLPELEVNQVYHISHKKVRAIGRDHTLKGSFGVRYKDK
ncbi:hypothetical protein CQW23_29265 [Capsicum baccatum]|uniref:Cytochrome 82C4 n=1 Tax=Capsicum baccatum TaxID=33114 RepID=A0A2G2VIY6_CAPBA|nr:hypothetical protein CQW23_29265 [Capsicum baccatum]